MEIERLWTEQHRSNLHAADSWHPSSPDVCLTYVGSGSGFHGQEQLKGWCGLHPTHLHSLHPSQLGRFDNRLDRISIVSSGDFIVEECILSVFHQEAMDWLAPGVQPCNKQLEIALVFSVKYSEGHLLSVRVYWDQASVLKQIGAFQQVLTKKDSTEAFAQLPILSGKQIVSRLSHPSPSNSNPFVQMIEFSKPAPKKTILDGMKSLLTDLPDAPITPARHRKLPAMESKIFKDDVEPQAEINRKIHPSQDSKIVFDDTVQELKPSGIQLKDNIFRTENEEQTPLIAHSITVSKTRMESHVFDDSNPFKPAYEIDVKRMESHLFDPDVPVKPAVEPEVVAERRHLLSHVFEQDAEPIKPCVVLASRRTNESQFVIGEDPKEAQLSCPLNHRNDSHFAAGASFELAPEEPRGISVATKPTQNFVFKSKIVFGGDDDDQMQAVKPNNKNQSQVCFDQDAALPPTMPSLKVSAPPGGKSQIIF